MSLPLTGAGLTSATALLQPSAVSGLILDLNADLDVYTDSALTTPATADADPVGGWKDQSGSAFHHVQATAGFRPTLRTNVLNGHSTIRFDGTDDWLAVASGMSLNGSDVACTIVAVASPTAFTTARVVWGCSSTASANPNFSVRFNGAAFSMTRRDDAALTKNISSGTPVSGSWYILTGLFSGTTGTLRANGVLRGSADTDLDVAACTFNRNGCGAYVRTSITNQFQGDIARICVFNRVLTLAEYLGVEAALAASFHVPT